jgi:hypothetical protein
LPLSTRNTNFIVKKTYIFDMFEGGFSWETQEKITCLFLFCLKVQKNPTSLLAFVWRCFSWETKEKNPTSHISFVWRWLILLRKSPYFTYCFCLKVILLTNNGKSPTFHITFVWRGVLFTNNQKISLGCV